MWQNIIGKNDNDTRCTINLKYGIQPGTQKPLENIFYLESCGAELMLSQFPNLLNEVLVPNSIWKIVPGTQHLKNGIQSESRGKNPDFCINGKTKKNID